MDFQTFVIVTLLTIAICTVVVQQLSNLRR